MHFTVFFNNAMKGQNQRTVSKTQMHHIRTTDPKTPSRIPTWFVEVGMVPQMSYLTRPIIYVADHIV